MVPLAGTQTGNVGRFRLLAGERVVQALTIDALRVTLTDRRVLVSGEEKRLFFFPGASTSRAAMTRDVNVASVGSRFLPDWLAVLGIGAVLVAFTQGLATNSIWFVIGTVALALWYFVRTEVLELSVDGQPFVALPAHTTDLNVAKNMNAFVDALFELKSAG